MRLVAALMALVLPSGPAIAAVASAGDNVPEAAQALTLRDGRVSGRYYDAPVDQIVEELARLAGFRVVWLGDRRSRPTSLELSGLSVTEALERLLVQNYLVVGGAPDAAPIRMVWVLGSEADAAQALAVGTGSAMAMPAAADAAPEADEMEPVFEKARSHPAVLGRLEAVDELERSAREDARARDILSSVGREDPDRRVRAAARRALQHLDARD